MIKHLPSLAILAVAAGIFTAAPAAHADSFYGPLTVTVWTGTGVTDSAALPTPTGAANYTFTYSGPLDFVNNNGQSDPNTFGEFFGSYESDISGLTPSELTAFLDTTMSTPGEVDNSYLSFVGTYTGGGSVTVSHDDGASLYTGSHNTNTVFTSPDPTSEIPSTGSLPGGTNSFDLIYVESNGAPSDLVVTGLSPVPEPGTFGLMALGMIGLAGLAYRGGAFNFNS